MSADWSPTPIPVPYADFGDPQSLNLYGYVRGLPTTKADIDGHCFPFCLALAGGGALEAGAGVALVSNPVGWTVLGVAAVATIGYVVYDHYHNNSSPPPSVPVTTTQTGTPETTATPVQTGAPGTTTSKTETSTPASTSQSGTVSTAAQTKDNTGAIYVIPGTGTKTGKPYVGRHNKPNPAKTRRSKDGRDRKQAEVVNNYPANDTQAGRVAEQEEIDGRGGIDNLDNKRNEIKKDK